MHHPRNGMFRDPPPGIGLKCYMIHVFNLFTSIGINSEIIWQRNILQRYSISVMWFLYNIIQAGTLLHFLSNGGAAALTFFYKFFVIGQLIAITLIVLHTTQLTTPRQDIVVWYKRRSQLIIIIIISFI